MVMAGASGLIGQALRARLQGAGYEVVVLVRRPAQRPDEVAWNPSHGTLDPAVLDGAYGIVNLSGAGIADRRWTRRRKNELWSSRVDAARTLVQALARTRHRPQVFVSASAIGFFGDTGERWVDEGQGAGTDFLANLCVVWEREAWRAQACGVRTVMVRSGVVLSPRGGALQKLLPIFRLGLGGRLGHGQAWMSWIALEDEVRVWCHCLEAGDLAGAVSAVAPHPVRHAEFVRVLAATLHRPAWLPVPRWVLTAALGEMAGATLLASQRVRPTRLVASGFSFHYPTLAGALQAELGRRT